MPGEPFSRAPGLTASLSSFGPAVKCPMTMAYAQQGDCRLVLVETCPAMVRQSGENLCFQDGTSVCIHLLPLALCQSLSPTS